jgi:hypothetical protein
MEIRFPILLFATLTLIACDTSEQPDDCVENGPDFHVDEAKGHVTIEEGEIEVAPDLHGTGWLTATGTADDGYLLMELDWNGTIEWSEGTADGFLLEVEGDVEMLEDWRGPYLSGHLGAVTEGIPDSQVPSPLLDATIDFEYVAEDVWVNLTIDEVFACLGLPGGASIEYDPCDD